MYTPLLVVHSWLRWLVLILAIVAIARAIGGRRSGRAWDAADQAISNAFSRTLDLQMLIGLVLYVALSPFTREAFGDFGLAMRDSTLRYWSVEHIFGMVVAVVLVHIGRARIKKARDDRARHRAAAVFFTVALIAMLASIPWPGFPHGRALFRV